MTDAAAGRRDRVALIAGRDALSAALARGLAAEGRTVTLLAGPAEEVGGELARARPGAAVYLAAARAGGGEGTAFLPDAADARGCLAAAAADARHAVVVANTAIQEPDYRNFGMIGEEGLARRPPRNRVAAAWLELEAVARAALAGSAVTLTLLRACPVPLAGGRDPASRLTAGGWTPVPAGFDPPLQLLAAGDLVRAVAAALAAGRGGTFNVVPAGVVPLRRAVALAGGRRLPLPAWWLRRVGRFSSEAGGDAVDYLRHAWTSNGEAAAAALGFVARRTSAEVAAGRRGAPHRGEPQPPQPAAAAAGKRAPSTQRPPRPAPSGFTPPFDTRFDDFGLDLDYARRLGRTLFRFLHDVWWRVEVRGLERVPREGPAVLVGIHRGFMPWDGAMVFHLLDREIGRHPRFLIHPGLIKLPWLAPFHTRLGGVPACAGNAARLLERGELLAIFPEGIRGAFRLYRDAYTLGSFGRSDYVRFALRHRVPIVPFVTVGSAEIFPIFGRLRSPAWKRVSLWPFIPLTPTFPLLPVPLPSKWHTEFLEPFHVARRHPPEAADDPALVTALSRTMQERMLASIHRMRERRPSIFYGSVFREEDPS